MPFRDCEGNEGVTAETLDGHLPGKPLWPWIGLAGPVAVDCWACGRRMAGPVAVESNVGGSQN